MTEEELMALRLLAAGLTAEKAARVAEVAERTMRRRIASARDALGAVSPTQAVARAVRRGLLDPDDSDAAVRGAWRVFRASREHRDGVDVLERVRAARGRRTTKGMEAAS